MMASEPECMAAAKTWRSSGSGNVREGISSSNPSTTQPRTLSFINWRVRARRWGSRSGRFRRRFRIHSSWIISDHRARKIPVPASSRRKSRRGAGYRTQASRTTVYPAILIAHLQILCFGYQIIKRLASDNVMIPLERFKVDKFDSAMSSYLMVWNFFLF